MPFIGNKPTAVPLSGADIQDGTITSADLQSGVIQNQSAFKNIIINGDMSIAQRGTSEASVGNSFTYFTVDRFKLGGSGSSGARFTMSQDTDVPTGQGFATSLKMDVTTADASLGSSDSLRISQFIEGQNLQYLKKGTANAESTTLSFWVKSNKTGTYISELRDIDNARSISKSYTIATADTWEKKTITFAGDTSGAFDNDNNTSLRLANWLYAGTDYTSGTLQTSWGTLTATDRAVGQVNLADSTSNYINITGVQLEAGTTASDFEFLPVDVNLQRCQRYYNILAKRNASTYFADAHYYNSGSIRSAMVFNPDMRATPTIAVGSGTNYYSFFRNGTADTFDGFTATSNLYGTILLGTGTMSGTAGQAGSLRMNDDAAFIAFDSEL